MQIKQTDTTKLMNNTKLATGVGWWSCHDISLVIYLYAFALPNFAAACIRRMQAA
jgi:hypothetical protein